MKKAHLQQLKQYGRVIAGAVVVLALLFVSLALTLRSGALAQGGPTVSVVADVLGQQQVTVAITGTNLTNLGGFEFDLGVNPPIAMLQSFQLGPFLGSSGRTTGELSNENFPNAFGAYSYGDGNPPGASGAGILAKATLNVVSEGVATLSLENAIFADTNANQQAVSIVDGGLQGKRLHSGWNLMSPCVDSAGQPVAQALQSINNDYGVVLGETGVYIVGIPPQFQTLHEVKPPTSYWVRVTAGSTITLTMASGVFDPHAAISLGSGWRYLGYCVGQTLPVADALQSIDGKYSIVLGETGVYIVGLPPQFQSLTQLEQGKGYLIRMTEAGNLVYPDGGLVAAHEVDAYASARNVCAASVQVTPHSTIVYGTVDASIAAGTIVEAVTPGGIVAGCSVVADGGAIQAMQVFGEDAEAGIPGFKDGEVIAWRVGGNPAAGESDVVWSDDREVHSITLRAEPVQRGSLKTFLPFIGR